MTKDVEKSILIVKSGMLYTEVIEMLAERLMEKFSTNEPIFTSEILETFGEYSRAYVFRLINKAEKKGNGNTNG